MKMMYKALLSAATLALPMALHAADMKLINAGELRFLTNPIYPPMEYVDPKTGELTGFDIDLGNAIAKLMGKEAIWIHSSFQQLQSSMQTGRGDLILSGMSDNTKRQQVMDFVDYITSGPVMFTLQADAAKYAGNADLCGKKVAGSRTGTFPTDVTNWSAANCEGKGKPAIQFTGTADSNAARLGLKQGRYDAVVQGIETIAYQMTLEPETFHLVGEPLLNNDVFGIGFNKDNTGLRDAVAKSLDSLIQDGTYAQLLNKWGLVHNAISKVEINGVK